MLDWFLVIKLSMLFDISALVGWVVAGAFTG